MLITLKIGRLISIKYRIHGKFRWIKIFPSPATFVLQNLLVANAVKPLCYHLHRTKLFPSEIFDVYSICNEKVHVAGLGEIFYPCWL